MTLVAMIATGMAENPITSMINMTKVTSEALLLDEWVAQATWGRAWAARHASPGQAAGRMA